MAEQSAAAQEPTMEEILASIRRIISEDDAPAGKPTLVEAAQPDDDGDEDETPTVSDGFGEVDDSPQVQPQLDGAHHAAADASDASGDRLFQAEPSTMAATVAARNFEPEPASEPFYRASAPPQSQTQAQPSPEPAPSMLDMSDTDSLISKSVGASVSSAFGALSRNVPMPAPGRSLEDLVKEMMKPMLRDWLDQNLPKIVEAKVQAEVERLSRQV